MNSDNHITQDYSNLPMNQTGNSFAPSQIPGINNNEQHTFNTINTVILAPQNTTFEFYLPLPNDTNDIRIYHVTYTELHPLENARLLNNAINLSHIPDHQFQYHYNTQQQIQQQIQQQQIQQPVVYQQSFDTMKTQSTSQVHSDNNAHDAASVSMNGTISNDIQDTGFQDQN